MEKRIQLMRLQNSINTAGHQLPTYTIERHMPEKREAKESNVINDLKR